MLSDIRHVYKKRMSVGILLRPAVATEQCLVPTQIRTTTEETEQDVGGWRSSFVWGFRRAPRTYSLVDCRNSAGSRAVCARTSHNPQ